jgi:hypothetical protein
VVDRQRNSRVGCDSFAVFHKPNIWCRLEMVRMGLLEAINHSILSFFWPATPLDTIFITQASVAFVLYLNHINKLDEDSIANGVS